jgi:hypothetical protein
MGAALVGKLVEIVGGLALPQGVQIRVSATDPTNGSSGTFAKQAGLGSICVSAASGIAFTNTGTMASPTWTPIASATDVYRLVSNKTGSPIAVNALVSLSGWDAANGCPTIVLADSNADLPADYVAIAAIADSTTGLVKQTFRSAANLNTNAATVGDAVYLDATPGGWTLTPPTAANSFVQTVGRVAVKSASVGVVEFDVRAAIPADSVDTNAIQDAAVTSPKLAAGLVLGNVDGVTLDTAGAGSTVEIKAGGVTATQLGTVAGTAAASKALTLDANRSVDLLQATTALSVGGTGVVGGASVCTSVTKRVTGLLDTAATDVATVTIPNAAHDAAIEVDVMGILGAGGSIGAGEAVRTVKYQVVVARTAGVNAVAGVSAAIGGAVANVAGGQSITSVVVTLSAVAGATTVDNTFTIKVAITRAGAGATNHIAVVSARVLNANATGVTIA